MAGIPRGGKLTIRVKALNDGTPDLLAWMCERSLPKNGTITFLETKTNKEMKTIKFTNGYCVNYEEKWEDKMGHFEEFTITCKKIEFGNVVYENDWA
jgi:type VI protein secretion system component Hcp